VECPQGGSFAYGYSLFGVFLYPAGVPIAMYGMLYYYKVPMMAAQKNKASRLRALLSIFRQEVEEGKEEGITGRELEKWWEVLGGWEEDPVEAIGGKAQLKALLRHTWHDPTLVEGDTEAKTLLLAAVERAKEEARIRSGQAEDEEEGDDLDQASLNSLRRKVNRLAEKGFSAKATLSWNGEFGEEEARAMRRAGFLFELYEVECWWFELFEMFRKLVMTSVLVFVTVGGLGQILVGLIVIFAAFVTTFAVKPYVSPNLNRCQIFSLGTQFLVLQYGLVLFLDGTQDTSPAETAIINGIMVFFSAAIFAVPPLSIVVEQLPTVKARVDHHFDTKRDLADATSEDAPSDPADEEERLEARIAAKAASTVNPAPYTLHPTPYALHPTPYTRNPEP